MTSDHVHKIFDATGRMIDAIGTPGFPVQLAAFCREILPYPNIFILVFRRAAPPSVLHSEFETREARETVVPYLQGGYLLDPFYNTFMLGAVDGVYRLGDLAPDDFFSSEYYRCFFAKTGMDDELGLFATLDVQSAIHLSLGLRDVGRRITDEHVERVRALAGILVALCRKHWLCFSLPDTRTNTGSDGRLDHAFEQFGSPVLSRREREVARFILKGHSSKSIARQLGISPDTVWVYRRRMYAKLGVCSQAGLFARFLDYIWAL